MSEQNKPVEVQPDWNVLSGLSRLLATENITVEHHKVSTAYFDLKTRTLVCPILKPQTPKEVYVLMHGHEVGHALNTDPVEWAAAIKMYPHLKSYLNVLEDKRIEAAIKEVYPGLRRDFFVGYRHMATDKDGFMSDMGDPNALLLIDRINLHYKIGAFKPIEFSPEEQAILRKADAIVTFADVVDLAKTIYAIDKQSLKDAQEQKVKANIADDMDDGYDVDPDDPLDDEDFGGEFDPDFGDLFDEDEDADDGKPKSSKGGDGDGDNTEDDSSGTVGEENNGYNDKLNSTYYEGKQEAISDEKVAKAMSEYVDDNCKNIVYAPFPDIDVDYLITPYQNMRMYQGKFSSNGSDTSWVDTAFAKQYGSSSVKEFKQRNDKFIFHLAKEFELKKNAWEQARVKEGKSGLIDPTKLYNYKFSEDLFRKYAIVPKGKNHGVVLIIDFSGSMRKIIRSVLEQAMAIAMFCRKVNIPFRVYGFTNQSFGETIKSIDSVRESTLSKQVRNVRDIYAAKVEFDWSGVSIGELLSDRMSTGEFNKAINTLCNSGMFSLGCTPLNQTLLAVPAIVERFRKESNAQITSVMVLTDGESDCAILDQANGDDKALVYVRAPNKKNYSMTRDSSSKRDRWNGGFATENQKTRNTSNILKMVKDMTGVNLIGYYLYDSRRRYQAWDTYARYQTGGVEAFKAQVAKKDYFEVDNFGYDKYFFLRRTDAEIAADAFAAAKSEAFKTAKGVLSVAKLADAFGKSQEKKRVNRFFVSEFMDLLTA